MVVYIKNRRVDLAEQSTAELEELLRQNYAQTDRIIVERKFLQAACRCRLQPILY